MRPIDRSAGRRSCTESAVVKPIIALLGIRRAAAEAPHGTLSCRKPEAKDIRNVELLVRHIDELVTPDAQDVADPAATNRQAFAQGPLHHSKAWSSCPLNSSCLPPQHLRRRDAPNCERRIQLFGLSKTSDLADQHKGAKSDCLRCLQGHRPT